MRFRPACPGSNSAAASCCCRPIDAAPLQCLTSVDGPPASFLALDPRIVLPDYRCALSASDTERLQAGADDALLWLVLLTINDRGATFANLRAPVVVHPASMVGYQVVPQDSLYPLRHPVALS